MFSPRQLIVSCSIILLALSLTLTAANGNAFKLVLSISNGQAILKSVRPLTYPLETGATVIESEGFHLYLQDASGRIVYKTDLGFPNLKFFDWQGEDGNLTGEVRELSNYTISVDVPEIPTGGHLSITDQTGKEIAGLDATMIRQALRQTVDYPIYKLDTLQYTGDPADRIDLVILGDGYIIDDTTRYWNHADFHLSYINSVVPYLHYWERFNIYMITTPSNESGADHPDLGLYIDTYFDAEYFDGRLLVVDDNKARGCATEHVPAWDEIAVLVNDGTYGGSGGQKIAVSSAYYHQVLIHEFGHSFGLLWDEYSYGDVCTVGDAPNCDDNDVNPKWQHWIDAGWPNVDTWGGCTCNNAYRPTPGQCMMEVLLDNYCIVCIEHLIQRIYEYAPNPVIVASPDNYILTTELTPQAFEFSYTDAVAHPALVSWSVDSLLYADSAGTIFEFTPPGFGAYEVSATIQDTTSLEIIVPDDWLITTHTWTLEVVEYICGDADGNLAVSISDAVHIINYIFGGGTAPEPLASADADCSGDASISDAVYIITFIFGGGPAPCDSCPGRKT